MHEVSLVSSLVEQIEEVARKESFARVLEIRIAIGALSGVEPSCVEFCFSEVTRDSVLEGAKLTMELVNVELLCRSCGQSSIAEDPSMLFCVDCHSGDIQIRKGREFKVLDLDVI